MTLNCICSLAMSASKQARSFWNSTSLEVVIALCWSTPVTLLLLEMGLALDPTGLTCEDLLRWSDVLDPSGWIPRYSNDTSIPLPQSFGGYLGLRLAEERDLAGDVCRLFWRVVSSGSSSEILSVYAARKLWGEIDPRLHADHQSLL